MIKTNKQTKRDTFGNSPSIQTILKYVFWKRKKKQNTNANNDVLLTEILVRLPKKSLLRFKCVSKHWHPIISSPHISRRLYPDTHLVSGLILHKSSRLINPEHDFIPLSDNPTSPPFKSLTFVNHPSGLRILQSCHGLICCSSFRVSGFKHDYYIYNPTTMQFVTLPQPGGRTKRTVQGISLAYDPDNSPHYKVVCVLQSVSPGAGGDHGKYSRYQIEIYSSKARVWKLSGHPFVAHIKVQFKTRVFWNGAIHWINLYDTSLYFNVDEEQLQEMPMPATTIPDGCEDESRLCYFGESREHLHLVEIYGPCTIKFDVYEMERDYSGWFVKYRVDLEVITIAFPEMIIRYLDPSNLNYHKFAILCIVREADHGESYMVLNIPGKAISYNLNAKTFSKICDFAPGGRYCEGIHHEGSPKFSRSNSYQYIETLACI